MAVLCVLLTAVCLYDYRYTRIPNGIVMIILVYGMWYRYWDAGGDGLYHYLKSSILILCVGYPLFRTGMVGAGDVKLFSVVSGFMSGSEIPCFLFYSLLIAAVISLVKIHHNHNGRERLVYLWSYLIDISRTGSGKLYIRNRAEAGANGICLSGPVLLSVFLHLGGVY